MSNITQARPFLCTLQNLQARAHPRTSPGPHPFSFLQTASEPCKHLCRKAIKRSSVAAAVGVAGYLAYKKPSVRSFFGAKDAYAANTGAGRFSLKGDSN